MIFWFKKAPMTLICNILVPSNEITRLSVLVVLRLGAMKLYSIFLPNTTMCYQSATQPFKSEYPSAQHLRQVCGGKLSYMLGMLLITVFWFLCSFYLFFAYSFWLFLDISGHKTANVGKLNIKKGAMSKFVNLAFFYLLYDL